jgi:hypothetical protein
MGNVKQFGATPDVVATPTITAGLYSALDAVGGLLTFTGLFKAQQAGGAMVGMVITDKGKQNAGLVLVLFNQTFTPTADNAAFDVSDTDLLNIIGYIEVLSGDYKSLADNSFVQAVAPIAMRSATADGTIYGQLYLPSSTPTYVSTTDLQVRLSCLSDKW